MRTAATTEKTPIAIAVVNQKTKSMRRASLPAATGSHGITSATAVVIAAATNRNSPSWMREPRRTRNRRLLERHAARVTKGSRGRFSPSVDGLVTLLTPSFDDGTWLARTPALDGRAEAVTVDP